MCRRSAGAGCGGSPRGGCPGAVGSSSCNARAPGCCRAPTRPSCRASTDSTFGEGETPRHLPQQRGTEPGPAAPCPAPLAVLGTKKPQHASQTHGVSVSSGEQKAFLASLKSLGAALQALPHNCAGCISLLLPVLLRAPENSPVGAPARQDCAYEADDRLSPDVTPSLRSRQRLRPGVWHRGGQGTGACFPASPKPTTEAVLPGESPHPAGPETPRGSAIRQQQVKPTRGLRCREPRCAGPQPPSTWCFRAEASVPRPR